VPAAVGIALAYRARGVKRTVLATIGDGSFQYSVQAIWTAAQRRLPVMYVAMRNNEYSILKSFAKLEQAPDVPGMDLPGLDIATVATDSDAAPSTSTAPRNWPMNSQPRSISRAHRHRRANQTASRTPVLTGFSEGCSICSGKGCPRTCLTALNSLQHNITSPQTTRHARPMAHNY
jgi:hypothetical protein